MKYIVILSNGLHHVVDTLKDVEAIILKDEKLVEAVFKGEAVSFKKVEKVDFGKAA